VDQRFAKAINRQWIVPPGQEALLTPEQLDGLTCICCGSSECPKTPVGWLGGCQVFACPACTDSALNDPGPFPDATQFLFVLHAAYMLAERRPYGMMQKLKDLYRILAVLPYVGREYTLASFAEDVYRLDRCYGRAKSPTGLVFRLDPGSTAARRRTNLLVVTSVFGAELTYYGIEFPPSLNLGKTIPSGPRSKAT
jgi:hypothetical protein